MTMSLPLTPAARSMECGPGTAARMPTGCGCTGTAWGCAREKRARPCARHHPRRAAGRLPVGADDRVVADGVKMCYFRNRWSDARRAAGTSESLFRAGSDQAVVESPPNLAWFLAGQARPPLKGLSSFPPSSARESCGLVPAPSREQGWRLRDTRQRQPAYVPGTGTNRATATERLATEYRRPGNRTVCSAQWLQGGEPQAMASVLPGIRSYPQP